MTHDEMIAVIQAAKDGKAIEASAKDQYCWGAVFDPAWNFYDNDYRVKPEPKVIWVNEYPSGIAAFASEEDAKFHGHHCSDQRATRRAVKYIEVIE